MYVGGDGRIRIGRKKGNLLIKSFYINKIICQHASPSLEKQAKKEKQADIIK